MIPNPLTLNPELWELQVNMADQSVYPASMAGLDAAQP